ncbi:MAG: long-chain-fatty-acid--CoA ligase [Candidatus Kariarchaeaceae archaeon]|jgi:long-chain acyl-CoA synthetase
MTLRTVLNLSSILDGSAREYSQRTAIIFGETRLTYAQLNGAANQIANGLKNAGINKGDHVALTCPNLPYFPMVYYAILKLGATVVPLNVLLKKREITYHLQDSDAVAYICFVGTPELPMGSEGFAAFSEVDTCKNFWLITPPGVESPIEGAPTLSSMMANNPPVFTSEATEPEDTAVILYTSGTTGQPKGAELTHANMFHNAMVSRGLVNSTSEDIHLITLPLFHSFGQTVQMNSGLLAGCALVLIARFDADAVLQGFQDENVTIFCGVPTMYWSLLNHPNADKYDLHKISKTLRLCCSGGAAIPVEVMRAFEEKYKVTILEGYGLSETSPVATFTRFDKERKPGSIGVPIRGVDVMVADDERRPVTDGNVGEILIRGHNVMKGYYKKPEATKKVFTDGWFATGDIGKKDDDGYYYIVDRVKDMIIRGGFNVYPREIEEVLLTHPAISLAAVVGIPDNQYGEEIKAYVVLKNGNSVAPNDLVKWSKNEMAAYKYPREFVIRDSLPMNATGKILKRVLRDS